jgi:squalene-hopene/tetraprenyl-beta-curcumene cyclase
MALAEAGLEEDEPILWRAREYLLGLQAIEGQGIGSDNWMYGGWGYEPHAEREDMHTADMSNPHVTIEALTRLQRIAERNNWGRWSAPAPENDAAPLEIALKKALVFLTRCQNLRQTNPLPRTGDDGGFRYRPHETRADGQEDDKPLRSYGSISYAGAKSLLFAGLTRDDPRVRAVADYIHRHWTVKENPGLGRQSLYYYYMTMSRCLNVFGAEVIVMPDGTLRDWRTELAMQLIAIQAEDGAWRNDEHRWLERLPELTTAYAVLAMTHAWENW